MATTEALTALWRLHRGADIAVADGPVALEPSEMDRCAEWLERAAILEDAGPLGRDAAEREATRQLGFKPSAVALAAVEGR